jgi:hypothetical protein
MNEKDIEVLADGLGSVVWEFTHDSLGNSTRPLKDRIDTLEKRIADSEAQKSLTLADCFRGGWMTGTVYARQSCDAGWLFVVRPRRQRREAGRY